MTVQFGIDRLLSETALQKQLHGKRLGLIGHPASVTRDLTHSLDALSAIAGLNLTCAFGPQHGMRGEKQDNMIETADYRDEKLGIPVFSLYGDSRRPTPSMMDHLDVFLFDLQDIGCRVYTYATTLLYVLEEASAQGKSVWVLDRPNPAGRPIDGLTLRSGWESFVGGSDIPMRHGLTMGELANWYVDRFSIDVDYKIVEMTGYAPNTAPGFGWPLGERSWINPSPNAPSVYMARCFSGTVMLEGTTLSEGRGTTRPLELYGAPDIRADKVLAEMERLAPEWMQGCQLRHTWFEPTFHKHARQLCEGIQIHTDSPSYKHDLFQPWRLQALILKAIRNTYPSYEIWRETSFQYEYTVDSHAIDIINGTDILRKWVDDTSASPADLEDLLRKDLQAWRDTSARHILYPDV